MLYITRAGHVDAERIKVKIFPWIERRQMDRVNGIVVHQTDSPTAQSTFNSYNDAGAHGAHFLIDKDGTIYQTASLYKYTEHVGKLRSRCLETHTCSPSEFKTVHGLRHKYTLLSRHEHKKPHPDRYPSNADSIGIEIVGQSSGTKGNEVYEKINGTQNAALKWPIKELSETLNISMQEVFKHPEVSYKIETEAGSAQW